MPTENIHLVTLETSGNQATIFSTNKLRNIIGASELIHRVGTEYVKRAIQKTTGRNFKVEDICKETPIEEPGAPDIEVVIATSGKALLLARGKDLAKKFITEWSRIIVHEAPGIDAFAVYSKDPVDLGDKNSFARAYKETMKDHSRAKMNQDRKSVV